MEVVPLYRLFRSDPSEDLDPLLLAPLLLLLLLLLRLFRFFALRSGFWPDVSVFCCSPMASAPTLAVCPGASSLTSASRLGAPSLTSTSRSGRW